MKHELLAQTAQQLVSKSRGILAADESTGTIQKRFAALNIECTEANRRAYRTMLFRSRGFGKYISGVILYDETLRQKVSGGRTLLRDIISNAGALPGIKVDKGFKPLVNYAGEHMTEGFDGLRERLQEYASLGARFTKWRAVIEIDNKTLPSRHAIALNAEALARYAALAQEYNMVPIVEPEILMDGSHSIERCAEVTEEVLHHVYRALANARVYLEGTLLKPNMVIAGKKCPTQVTTEQVAQMTVRTLQRTVPAAVPGIVFLSGGQSEKQSTENLDAMNKLGKHPWALSFSYGRALQQTALNRWQGQPENVPAAQEAFIHRAHMNSLAARGKWTLDAENTVAISAQPAGGKKK